MWCGCGISTLRHSCPQCGGALPGVVSSDPIVRETQRGNADISCRLVFSSGSSPRGEGASGLRTRHHRPSQCQTPGRRIRRPIRPAAGTLPSEVADSITRPVHLRKDLPLIRTPLRSSQRAVADPAAAARIAISLPSSGKRHRDKILYPAMRTTPAATGVALADTGASSRGNRSHMEVDPETLAGAPIDGRRTGTGGPGNRNRRERGR